MLLLLSALTISLISARESSQNVSYVAYDKGQPVHGKAYHRSKGPPHIQMGAASPPAAHLISQTYYICTESSKDKNIGSSNYHNCLGILIASDKKPGVACLAHVEAVTNKDAYASDVINFISHMSQFVVQHGGDTASEKLHIVLWGNAAKTPEILEAVKKFNSNPVDHRGNAGAKGAVYVPATNTLELTGPTAAFHDGPKPKHDEVRLD
mmetsp:Transcript_15065/g.27129  ORF Transcript_15065/g.27129 Transcript_15065/m.27129 type:complete len:209 (+) Transcript_15065:68-694(+)|eukprot:CAMPEP_0197518482 /NCGR_PEP_ID=MMETSP1318-20131121/3683_1 /TAXON_ID=552666 /ORGANISM="Partenskyella glossopodia, Strain RCC365" /LENGTH=208 /DNA_ID=CAMNT_0043068855 /DNA_START=53 /DNA_END=679 /DNA_ORIENTATION=+